MTLKTLYIFLQNMSLQCNGFLTFSEFDKYIELIVNNFLILTLLTSSMVTDSLCILQNKIKIIDMEQN